MSRTFTPSPAVLLLADGTVFYGKSVGKIGTTAGEICFNTSMTGYQEIFTDPSYYGQIIIMTNVHTGNYGAHHSEVESDTVKISGLITKRYTAHAHSRQTATETLQEYFERNGLVGISDVDTRALTLHVRTRGAMNCIISSETTDIATLREKLAQVPDMNGLDLAISVTTPKPYAYGNDSNPLKVAVLDCGVKESILKCLTERGVYARVFPANTTFEEMEKFEPHGYFISNGPGDPASMTYAIQAVRKILDSGKPVFGICLGHQLLALACGVSTRKMHHGHRGANHPVKNLLTGLCEITSQNHGFEVSLEELQKSDTVELTHINLNDGTVEGIRIKGRKAFSVQYHPESSPGPHDSRYLFDRFVEYMQGGLAAR
ncbi:MAG: glutamine-hydrolyzing carbamoyl-phosphate synthase small subunit [Chitinophagales bacterium]|nr:glutamine-hydrolyzing carbamoyl-phosphate synthase small subunit [Chitinophagales bacterium]MDW8418755.1 glutamine-hydrolyzing carbamoyl-phosphate synthase small subunit [Chitinophagales bacterium]